MGQNENSSAVGERIKHFREKRGLTQKELGEKCGIDAANIRKYESGKQNPKLATLNKIADALGVTALDLTDFMFVGQEGTPLASILKPGEHASLEEWERYKRYAESKARLLELLRVEREQEQKLLDQMIDDFQHLNDEGQTKAAERVRELTEIARYRNVYADALDQYKAEHAAPDAAGLAADDAAEDEPKE